MVRSATLNAFFLEKHTPGRTEKKKNEGAKPPQTPLIYFQEFLDQRC
jgi:hypothetical protein